ncbi:MAG: hypothetical protein Q9192_003549 [Flavoplaca navasiana]
MAQAQAHFMTPPEHVAIALQKAVSVAALATFYLVHHRSPSREDFHTLIYGQAFHPEDQAQGSAQSESRSATGQTGYLDLPPELRLQILEEALVVGAVHPYHGLTPYERWQHDCQILRAAQRQAWRNFMHHPSTFRLFAIRLTANCYFTVFVDKTHRLSAIRAAPRFLSTCHTACDEGGKLFYSKNTFCMAYGPLSNSRGYYDHLMPEHKRLIRHMTVILHMGDLTVEAFDYIEDQLRAKDVARGRLPRDNSVEDWLAPVVYHLISIWRSKLAWLKEWTWLEDLEIQSGLCTRGFPNVLPKSMSVKIQGYYLPVYLEGIGPSEPHCPLVDCYKDCNNIFARQMRTQEEFMWTLFAWMIECFGWKATKAIIRRKVWEETTGRRNDGLV